jgi:hypothetical protein
MCAASVLWEPVQAADLRAGAGHWFLGVGGGHCSRQEVRPIPVEQQDCFGSHRGIDGATLPWPMRRYDMARVGHRRTACAAALSRQEQARNTRYTR